MHCSSDTHLWEMHVFTGRRRGMGGGRIHEHVCNFYIHMHAIVHIQIINASQCVDYFSQPFVRRVTSHHRNVNLGSH